MHLDLTNKSALITGASRGIGRAIAETLAAEGMRLAIVARSVELLDELASALPTQCVVIAADLRDRDRAQPIVEEAVSRLGDLDLLVNNAGATRRGDFLALTDEDWDDGFSLKLFGAVALARAAWPHLQASQGSIINIAGVGGRTASAEFTIGGSVNAAMMYWTKALAQRGIVDGVRVNAINPGSIATARLRTRIRAGATEHGTDEATAAAEMATSLGVPRFGDPHDVARAVAFLASPTAAGYCQGTILDVDGGQTRGI